MRFLVVAQPNGWGGTEVNTTLMIDALGSRTHDVDLIEIPSAGARHYATRWTNRHGQHEEHPLGSGVGAGARRWWIHRLRQRKPSAVVLAKGYLHTVFTGLDLACRQLGIPQVVVEHEPAIFPADLEAVGPLTFYRELLSPGYRRLQLQQALAAHRISVSAITDRAMNGYLRWTKRHTSVIHPGIRFDEFVPDPDGAAALRGRLGIPADAMVFGAIGRFHPKKRFDLALRLFAEAKLPENSFFLLAGGGDERAELERVIGSLGIEHRVRLTGWADGEARLAGYSAIDCFLMVSILEGLGMTLVEAIACGCRCIATDCGGPAEVLTDRSLGLLVREGEWDAVREEMARLAVERAGAGWHAGAEERRALVRREYDATAQNEKYADLLESVARARGRAA